jgi:SAM-dependent MidA family methyltransferase
MITTDLPQPPSTLLAHSAELAERLRARIAEHGSLTFAEFMQAALYEPGLGYYTAGIVQFGPGGDFVTAPEISSLFSYCLADQCSEILRSLSGGSILELGGGSGVMAADILSRLAAQDSLPEHYFILELSGVLRQRQQATLRQRVPDCLPQVRWLSSLDEVQFSGVVLANEVLDAMPVSRFRCGPEGLQELCVDWDNKQQSFVWTARPAGAALQTAVETLEVGLGYKLPDGYESELNPLLEPWLKTIHECLHTGVVFCIDYGYPQAEYYLPERSMGTLSCHYRHRMHADPLIYVGLQDITAFVDFSAAAAAGERAGFQLGGFINQANFLLNCGIERIHMRQGGSDQQLLQRAQQIKTLLLPSEMGERFKVLVLDKLYNRPLIGFGAVDQRHRL